MSSSGGGAWIYQGDNFHYNWLTMGFLRRTTDSQFFTGDIAYGGLLPLYSDDEKATLLQWLDDMYPTENVACLGDSRFNSAEWIELELEAHSRDYAWGFSELATGGNTIGVVDTGWAAAPDFATTALILVGINDIIAGTTGTTAGNAFDALVDTALAKSTRRIIVCNETPFGANASWTAGRQAELDTLRARIAAKAAMHDRVFLYDSYSVMDDPGNPGSLRASDTTDGLHFNTAGTQRFASGLFDQFYGAE